MKAVFAAAAADVSENRQEHHDEPRPDTDQGPIRFVAIPRKDGQQAPPIQRTAYEK
jgi:hypothetical protein